MSRSSPTPVIIDTDPGVDDALALLLAAASPELDVVAVTTVAGNVDLSSATGNARRILPVGWAGRPLPPIYRGETGASETAQDVHGLDGLGGAATVVNRAGRELYPPSAPVSDLPATDAILRLARERPGELTLVTLGPLTNLARAVQRDPEGVRMLKRVVIMGGAFREAGNITPYAEFNIYVDPESAQVVCRSGVPLFWVPVDVTHRCLMTAEDLEQLPDTPRVAFTRNIAEWCLKFHHEYHGEWAFYLHDPLAVGTVVWPELVRPEPMRVNVETDGRYTRGMTVADFRPEGYRRGVVPNAEVCMEVDAAEFVNRFKERLGQ